VFVDALALKTRADVLISAPGELRLRCSGWTEIGSALVSASIQGERFF
jgi:hypothetical protein